MVEDLMIKIQATSSGADRVFSNVEKNINNIQKTADNTSKGMSGAFSRGFDNIGRAGTKLQGVGNQIKGVATKAESVGTSLTNSITKPAGIAVGAIGGLTAALGFKRLVGMDNAKAKLEGLGYSAKEVGTITGQVTKAIEGGMTTMAEGTDIAAGALAAGVKEGKELEHYIKLVGDAAVGANRPVADMAMIFNRVQGQGKLMTQELNMIEEGMPGFSNAMAKHMGVSYEAFREMVTNGEVSSKEFLTVMDDFAGGMAAAQSKSFSGMMKNVKAYVGIIGESLLGGVFEKSKKSLSEFIDLLSSEEMGAWAERTGQKIGVAFTNIANNVQKLIGWFMGLNSTTKKLIGGFGLFLTALGPVILVFGKMAGVVAGLITNFGTFLTVVSKIGPALGFLSGPIGWVVLGLGALATAFVVAYKKSDRFREIINGTWEIIKVFTKGIGGAIISGLKNLGNWLGDVGKKAKDFGKALYDSWAKTEVGKKRIEQWNKLKDTTKKVFDAIADGGKKATDTTDVLGKGVSKTTKSALKNYVDFSEKASAKLAELTLSGKDTTKKQLDDFKSLTDGMQDELEKQLEKRRKAQLDNMQAIFNDNKSAPERFKIDAEAQEKYIKSIQDTNDKEKKEAEKLFADYEKIRDKAFEDGVVTPEEQKKINDALDKLNKFSVEKLSESEKEQMTILGRLQKNKEALSMKEAQDVVKQSVKLRDQRIKDADKEYQDELDRIAQNEELSDEDRKKALGAAKQKWLDAKGMAENTHNDVLGEVKAQYKNIGDEQDLQTGKAYSSAEKWWMAFEKGFKDFFTAENINNLFTELGRIIATPFKKLGETLSRWWSQYVTFGTDFGNGILEGISKFFTENWEHLKNVGKQIWSLIKQGWSLAYGGGAWVVNFLWNMLRTMGSTITNGAQTLWQGLKTAWDESKNITFTTWSWISGFFKNIWNGLWGTVRNISGWIWNKIKTIWDLVKSKTLTTYTWIRDFLFNIWQSVWGTIRNVGTWIWNKVRNSWDSVRNKTLSTYTWIKNFLFNTWNNIWNTIKNAATWIWNKVRNTWDAVRNKTVSIYTWIKEFIYNIWNAIWNKIKNTATWIWNKIRYTWDLIKNKTSGVFTSVWNTIKRLWGLIWGYIRDTINLIKNKIINTWDNIRDRMWEIVTSIKNNVVNKFKDMYNGAKTWLDRIKSYLIGIKDKMASAAADLGISVANAAIRGLNKMINGINKISEGITDKKLIDPIKEISGGSGSLGAQLSTGTGASKQVKTDSQGRLRHNTLATVNDKGPGNGKGRNGHQELIRNKNGSMFAPKGKDVLMNLRKGQSVISGRETQELSSAGLIPKFNSGTGALGKIAGKWGAKLQNTKHQVEDKAENASMAIDAAKTAGIKEGASALGHGMGNVMKWVDKPKELVETMMKKMGVDFSGIAGGTGRLVRGAYSKLIPSLIDKVKDMFSEVEGGDGDASWLLNGKYPQLQPFGKYIGMTMNGTDNHYGLDFGMPTGTKIRALTAGKITQAGWVNTGGGNQIELKEPGGKWFQWYMHMSKVLAKKGQNVSAGDVIGLSGNTGSSNTPHLHIQRMKGYPSNDTAVDPTAWLKSLTGGGSKSAKKWTSDIKRAAKAMGVSLSGGNINDIVRLIDRESGGRSGVIQAIRDINSGGNEARGLLQYTPGTFAGYKVPGKGNIMNGYHQLLAFFNNSNWRRDLSAWKARIARGATGWGPSGIARNAEGGIINNPLISWVAEGGFSESIMSHDPAHRTRSKQIHDKTGKLLGFDQDTQLLQEIVQHLEASNELQGIGNRNTRAIANKDFEVNMDGKAITDKVNRILGSNYNQNSYFRGGV